MTSVGAYLRELREGRGVPLGEIARTTRVAQRYLEALEADAFEALPPPVFTRGYIRAYCQALMEPPEEALARYEVRDGRAPQAAARPLVSATRTGGAEPRTRGTVIASLVLLVVLGMALFTVALVIQPRERGERPAPAAAPVPSTPTPAPSASQPTPPATAPSPVAAPSTARTPAATPPPAAPSRPAETMPPVPSAPAPRATPVPAAVPATPPGPSVEAVAVGAVSPYRLVARTSEATWIRVRTQDGRISEENVPAGEVREWISDRPFELMIGNAGGVSFELNGRALPALGGRGTVVPRLVLPPER